MGLLISDSLTYYTELFSRTVGEDNIGILVRTYEGEVLSVNDRFLNLAGTTNSATTITIEDFPWRNLKRESDAADVLAKSGGIKEAASLYFHPVKLEWVHSVSVKFSHQSSAASGQPLEWEGRPVIYVLMMDVSHLSRMQSTFRAWSALSHMDYEKERVQLAGGGSLSRNDLICLSYYLEDSSQSDIAQIMNQSVKTVEKRIASIKTVLLNFDPECDTLYSVCRKHGIRHILEIKRDWFDKTSSAVQISNMQWQSFIDWKDG